MSDQNIVSELPKQFRFLVQDRLNDIQLRGLNERLEVRRNSDWQSRTEGELSFADLDLLVRLIEYAFVHYVNWGKSLGETQYADLCNCVELGIKAHRLAKEASDEQR